MVRESNPDHTALDPKNKHYDPQSTVDQPRWCMVDIKLKCIFTRPLPLHELRGIPTLRNMELLRQGSRLSVQPVRKQEFDTILQLAAST